MKNSLQWTIFRHTVIIIFISALALCICLLSIFYSVLNTQAKKSLHEAVVTTATFLDHGEFDIASLNELGKTSSAFRITLIEPGGTVAYESSADIHTLANHADRQEMIDAMEKGNGTSSRLSNTLRTVQYYEAVKLHDGTIVRLSIERASVLGLLLQSAALIAGVLLFVLIASAWISMKLTERIVKPLEHFDASSEPLHSYDELSPLIRKINGQKQEIERRLLEVRKNADTIQNIVLNMKEGILLLDKNGVIVACNDGACSILGFQRACTNKHYLEVLRNHYVVQGVKKALSGINNEQILHEHERDYQAFAYQTDNLDVIVLLLDVTDRHRAEKMRMEFTANVSHELKTPLTNILGYSEMLSANMVREEDKTTFSNRIMEETQRLILLIDDILLLSNLDEDHSVIEMKEVHLKTIAMEAEATLSMQAEEKRVTVSVEGSEGVMQGNERLLRELVYNLLDNSIKYNFGGGNVDITVRETETTVELAVQDTGIGIPQVQLPRVFERFYRVDKSRSRKTGGTGLGLSIAKHIASLHNARITIASEESKGTTVIVQLPKHGAQWSQI